ncbi:AhpA/YtjB family protein [Alteromonas ponticola]|uniref:AhpA/YtjB family protein n=1 Tax=Alteromonas aquimaris TaxID=2998417 RepID=A0ABT3P3P2_9ALTE|nr:AhpA/YtjB family protein [Alteromonas aquimaris]MCW8107394.1 AhpA/YtjB family protein [Alteromonas aquimaris]
MTMELSGQSSPGHTLTTSVDAADRRNLPAVRHSGYKTLKRIIHTFSLCLVITLLIYFFYLYQQHTRQWAEFEAGQTGTLLVHQYAMLLAPAVAEGNIIELGRMLSTLDHHPALINADVYDTRGILLNAQENNIHLLKHVAEAKNWMVHVEDIRNDSGQTIGYLRLIFNAERLLELSIAYEKRRLEMMYLVMIVTLLAGIYLARSFYKLRPVLRRRLFPDNQSTSFPSKLNKRR